MASEYSSVYLQSEECDIACDDCKAKNIQSRAVSYCNLCKEAFCPACEKGHRASKRTKDHKLVTGAQFEAISIGDSRRIPSILICDKHQLLVSRFCKDHGGVFCPTCETISHRACNTNDIKKHASRPETSLELSKIRDKLTGLEKKYTEIEKERIKDKKELATKMKDCMDEIEKVRKDINAILDGLEKNMKAQVKKVESKISREIEDHLTIAKDMLKQIIENTKILKECGETEQTDTIFVGIKTAEMVIQEYDDTSKQIEKEIAGLDLDFNPNSTFEFVRMEIIESLGKLEVRRWQRYVSCLNVSVRNVKRHRVGSISVRSIAFLPDGQVVLACFEDGLKLLDEKFRQISQLAMRAIGVCLVSNTEVLVSLGQDAQIQFVEVIPKMKIKDTIKVGRICKGIDFNNGEIYVTCHDDKGNGEVRVLDEVGNIKRRLGYDDLLRCLGYLDILRRHWEYETRYRFTDPLDVKVTTDGQRVIVTDNHFVTCMNQQGDVVYRYKDGDLKRPSGLMVDGEGNAMVCGFNSNDVHVISADGRKQRILLNEVDGISKPLCITYRQTDGCLAVGTESTDGYSLCTFEAWI